MSVANSVAPKHSVISKGDVEGVEIGDWKILCCKNTILKSDELETFSTDLHTKNLPEMVFGKNYVNLMHKSGFSISLNCFDALKAVKHHNVELPKVAFAKDWMNSKQSTLQENALSTDINKLVYEYDWTFTSDYTGTIRNENDASDFGKPQTTTDKIDTEMLKKPDPILFYGDIHLFEDELADNGTALFTVKVRVMPQCFFVLMRYWLRIDHVMFRVNDTRLFHEFKKDYLLREYQSKESTYQSVAQIIPDPTKHMDQNLVSPLLKIKETRIEKILLNKKV